MAIGKVISKYMIETPMKLGNSTKPLKMFAEAYKNSSKKTIKKVVNTAAVSSIVIKDGAGCYYYVTQSLNNDRIPEEKRPFVAALDLANGGLMIATQIGMLFLTQNKKFMNKMFGTFTKKTFNSRFITENYRRLKAKDEFKILTKLQKAKTAINIKSKGFGAFESVLSLVASTIVAKRMIVPFVSTPLATKIKEKYLSDDTKTPKKVAFGDSYSPTFKNIKKNADKFQPELFDDFLKKMK